MRRTSIVRRALVATGLVLAVLFTGLHSHRTGPLFFVASQAWIALRAG